MASKGGSKRAGGKPAKARVSRAGKSRTAASKAKSAAQAKPAAKARPAGKAKASPRPRAAVRSKAAAKPRSAAKRRRVAAPGRVILPRQEPATLRCKMLSAALTVDDLARSLRFYVDGLGFFVKDRWERDGVLLGVEMLAGACMIGLSQDDWAKGRDRSKGIGMRLYLETTQDIDALAERIKARGVEARGPETAPWGARVLNLTDPDGFQLTLLQEANS